MIDLSIVIVNWNVKDFLRDCINSIIENAFGFNYEIIVADNASSDGSVEYIKSHFPKVVLIQNNQNLGFAKANNQCFKIAKGEYIFILNPDTIVLENSIQLLLSSIKSDKEVGMIGPKILNKKSKDTLVSSIQWTSARKYPNLMKDIFIEFLQLHKLPLIGAWLLRYLQFPYDYNKEQYVNAISGAAMIIKKKNLIELGGFDEQFLHGGEDVYLCRQINKSHKLVYCPKAHIIHFSGQSSKHSIVSSSVKNYISNAIYYRKVKSKGYSIVYKASLLLIFIPIRIGIGIFKSFNYFENKERVYVEFKLIQELFKKLIF